MRYQPTSIIVLGTDSALGDQWLDLRLPDTSRRARHRVLPFPAGELDAVVFGEELRLEARRAGVQLSVGVAEGRAGAPVEEAVTEAVRALGRCEALGGGMTLARSIMLQAA